MDEHLSKEGFPMNIKPDPGAAGIDIYRDAWGIPHIKTRTRDEAFAALGFAHARDRLWQMEALLRRGTGRYAEWVGEAAVKADILARQVDTTGASQRDYAALGEETRVMLESYARGVNAFIATGYRTIEYRLLEAEPATWLPWHSIAVMRQIGFLMGSVWWKLWRAAALPILGLDGIAKLRFEDGGSELLCIPPGVEKGQYRAAVDDLRPGAAALLEVAAQDVVGGGSNNWALGPSLTATGRPIVAGDPHRVLEMPNMYAQMHIACDEFDIIGLTVPGVPGFPHFAHNGHVAWCVTHAFVDIHDLYIERFSDDGGTYLFKDEWLPVRRRREEVVVKDRPSINVEVVETAHGPVIVDAPGKTWGLALRSMQFTELDRSFDALIPMMRARTVETLYEATREWGLIDHNLVAGDVARTGGSRSPAGMGNTSGTGRSNGIACQRRSTQKAPQSSPPTIALPKMAATISARTPCRRTALAGSGVASKCSPRRRSTTWPQSIETSRRRRVSSCANACGRRPSRRFLRRLLCAISFSRGMVAWRLLQRPRLPTTPFALL
jgi:penicillin amidase